MKLKTKNSCSMSSSNNEVSASVSFSSISQSSNCSVSSSDETILTQPLECSPNHVIPRAPRTIANTPNMRTASSSSLSSINETTNSIIGKKRKLFPENASTSGSIANPANSFRGTPEDSLVQIHSGQRRPKQQALLSSPIDVPSFVQVISENAPRFFAQYQHPQQIGPMCHQIHPSHSHEYYHMPHFSKKVKFSSTSHVHNNSIHGSRIPSKPQIRTPTCEPRQTSCPPSRQSSSNMRDPGAQAHKVGRIDGRFDRTYSNQPHTSRPASAPILLLARPQDDKNLNAIHSFVRRNIEVFAATDNDITAPAPGRKHTLVKGQVGLRCVHCRHITARKRTKRATCYPSSIARVYNCVSDMKFDHFSNCKYLPTEERSLFNDLKAGIVGSSRAKSGSNTAKYYRKSAVEIGMIEAKNGIVLLKRAGTNNKLLKGDSGTSLDSPSISIHPPELLASQQGLGRNETNTMAHSSSPKPKTPAKKDKPKQMLVAIEKNNEKVTTTDLLSSQTKSHCRPLACPHDIEVLNPIHCFVRNNVEVFIADSYDVAAPAPGRKNPVILGQVGIRCIHCKGLPIESRVKRAICYPPTIANIYHAVSNMKFDHFSACKGLSAASHQQFLELKASSKCVKVSRKSTSSTAKYYTDSARKYLGLIDTESGIKVMNGSFFQSKRGHMHTSSSQAQPYSFPTYKMLAPKLRSNVHSLSFNSALPPLGPQFSTLSNECGDLTHIIYKKKQLDGMSALTLAATDPQIRVNYEKLKSSLSSSTMMGV